MQRTVKLQFVCLTGKIDMRILYCIPFGLSRGIFIVCVFMYFYSLYIFLLRSSYSIIHWIFEYFCVVFIKETPIPEIFVV